ncbi:hypothetical protein [Cellulomonas denverensis]|uniref:hypothetical protein n=1 Tax=Cellulomonas denverensis TaxID=264297 RepID=UPI0035EF2E4E
MTAFRSIGAPLENDGSGTEPIEVRKDLAGLVTGAGVLPGADSPLVSGTAGWAYQVGRCNLVSSRGSSDGVHLWGNDGPVTVSTADDGTSLSAPGSGVSRVDIIYGLHPSNGENADTTSQPYFAVRKGTPASSPQPPTLPAGALELARNTMTSSATSTSSTGNSIQQTAEAAEPIESAPLTIQYSSEANVDMTGAANAWVDWLTLATLNVPSWATRVDVVIEVNAMTYSSTCPRHGSAPRSGPRKARRSAGRTTRGRVWVLGDVLDSHGVPGGEPASGLPGPSQRDRRRDPGRRFQQHDHHGKGAVLPVRSILVGELRTGRRITQIPVSGASWSVQHRGTGEISVDIPIQAEDFRNLEREWFGGLYPGMPGLYPSDETFPEAATPVWRPGDGLRSEFLSAIEPARCFMAILEDDIVVEAGPIWAWDYTDSRGILKVKALGLRSLFNHRYVMGVLASGWASWSVTYSGLSLGTIAKRLVALAMSHSGGGAADRPPGR